MPFTRTDRNQVFNSAGQILSDVEVVVDITAPTIDADLRSKARTALTANQTFLALVSPTNGQTLAQVQRLTRECSAIIRLLIAGDLLAENTDT